MVTSSVKTKHHHRGEQLSGSKRNSVSASSRTATLHGRGSARTPCCDEKFALNLLMLTFPHIDLKFSRFRGIRPSEV